MKPTFTRAAAAVFTLLIVPLALAAQDAAYRQPPAPIAQMLDAEALPAVLASPNRDRLLLAVRAVLPTIAEVGAPFLRLAGERLNPRSNAPWREVVFTGLSVKDAATGAEHTLQTPRGARLVNPAWSPDGTHVAFVVSGENAMTLWVGDVATGVTHQASDVRLNSATGAPCSWTTSAALICKTIVRGRGPAPAEAMTPTGPVIEETEGAAAGNPTFEDLLKNARDESLFDYYFTSQVAVISLDGTARTLGEPAIYTLVCSSPDARFVLVQSVHRPYSYHVPLFRFPTRTAIWTIDGANVRELANVDLQERVGLSSDAVEQGLRDPEWRSDAPATVVWAEALDGGDPSVKADKRDRLLTLAAPFAGAPATLVDLEYRWVGATWASNSLAFIDEGWRKTRRARTWSVNPAAATPARVVFDRSSEDRYANPGEFVTSAGPLGRQVLLTSRNGASAYLVGAGASPEGDRPFLDRFDISTGKTTRLWRSQAPFYEQVVALLDRDASRIVTRRESIKDVPDYFLRDIASGKLTALTRFKDPAPQFAGVSSQLITYKRADGVQLSATLYLPAGYDKTQGTLPFFFWAYPQEFKSAIAASQVVGSPYRFTRPSGPSHLFLLTQGYGVLDGPTMPIVGEGDKEPNDTYVQQLVASAQAAVEKVVELGVADRNRIGVGGHSYGAFMTANLLAHSKLFRAGIARSGAYNRTLTPFGFQNEERSYWQGKDVYQTMSPFMYADSISAPILLIHGAADDNTGTYPEQSERFFAALKGNGKKARLVMLPAEPHGYRARESIGHTLWEMVNWMDTYVKPRPTAPATE
jgi:dipeptidyl aminopeptidase/acylaminoacyl peptidase